MSSNRTVYADSVEKITIASAEEKLERSLSVAIGDDLPVFEPEAAHRTAAIDPVALARVGSSPYLQNRFFEHLHASPVAKKLQAANRGVLQAIDANSQVEKDLRKLQRKWIGCLSGPNVEVQPSQLFASLGAVSDKQNFYFTSSKTNEKLAEAFVLEFLGEPTNAALMEKVRQEDRSTCISFVTATLYKARQICLVTISGYNSLEKLQQESKEDTSLLEIIKNLEAFVQKRNDQAHAAAASDAPLFLFSPDYNPDLDEVILHLIKKLDVDEQLRKTNFLGDSDGFYFYKRGCAEKKFASVLTKLFALFGENLKVDSVSNAKFGIHGTTKKKPRADFMPCCMHCQTNKTPVLTLWENAQQLGKGEVFAQQAFAALQAGAGIAAVIDIANQFLKTHAALSPLRIHSDPQTRMFTFMMELSKQHAENVVGAIASHAGAAAKHPTQSVSVNPKSGYSSKPIR